MEAPARRTASDALLRQLAAVPPGARVVDVACAEGHHTGPIAALGFDVWACDPDAANVAAVRRQLDVALGEGEGKRRVARAAPDALGYPDAFADWLVASALDGTAPELVEAFREARRVLKPGGWLWVELATAQAASPEALRALALVANLAEAEAPVRDDARGTVRGLFRRVDADVVR